MLQKSLAGPGLYVCLLASMLGNQWRVLHSDLLGEYSLVLFLWLWLAVIPIGCFYCCSHLQQ